MATKPKPDKPPSVPPEMIAALKQIATNLADLRTEVQSLRGEAQAVVDAIRRHGEAGGYHNP